MVFISSISPHRGKKKTIPCLPNYSGLIKVLSISTGVILSCGVSCISEAFFSSSHIADRFARSTKFEQGEIFFVN